MKLTRETARACEEKPEDVLCKVFGSSVTGAFCASYLSLSGKVIGAAGLPFYAPLSEYILNFPLTARYLESFSEQNSLFLFGDIVRHLTESVEAPLPAEIAEALCMLYASVCGSAGKLDENGDHLIDLKAGKIGTHFDVNLLIGNRIGFPSPLLTTPKGALDSLGRGSFRGTAARQVTSTRYNLIPEENGEPCNRQFYLIENGEVIFYSADAKTNVYSAVCRHSQNHTVITYETACGLRIVRTVFILPQEEGMPEAVEMQHVTVKNKTDRERNIKIVFTGMFGLATPESAMNDIIYASVTWESGIWKIDGVPAVLSPNPHPKYLKPYKRFALLLSEGEFMDEYTASYSDFIGNGTLYHPQNAAHLSCSHTTKIVPFFAVSKKLPLPAGGMRAADCLVGMTITKGGEDDIASGMLARLIETYRRPHAAEEALARVKAFSERYAGYLQVKTGDADFDAYVNRNLPFQVYYQSYVSRSFAWTQKAYREIGFREIQDMFASLPYITGMGENELARGMLGEWLSNVWEMGYANHNFYETGKEPGMCSDDGLWLVQAVYRYVCLTQDTAFLSESYPVAGKEGCRRTVMETLLAIVTYSGSISVGAHGLPLLDKADWNDCLKVDDDWIDGPEKERRYLAQLAEAGEAYGVPLRSTYSESVMNAFLLKIAYDNIASLATHAGDAACREEMETRSASLAERIRASCWKEDFFARVLVGGTRDGGYTYLGAAGDGLSADENIPGTYFLNSFSWSILSGIASEAQIHTMLDKIEAYLVTDAGIKLCTPCDLGRLATGTATDSYFPGDRENGGVFKHAAMMAACAALCAAKTVSNPELAARLSRLAYFAVDTVLPYKTMEHPFVTKGNPRFCTQYNNSRTGENIGPMLSGTASWLSLTISEMLGFSYTSTEIVFSPLLPPDMETVSYTVKAKDMVLNVHIRKHPGFARVGADTVYTFDGKPFSGRIPRPCDGKVHTVEIQI